MLKQFSSRGRLRSVAADRSGVLAALGAPAIARADAVTEWNVERGERPVRRRGAGAAGIGASPRDGARRHLRRGQRDRRRP